MLERGQIMFGSRRDRVRAFSSLLCQVLRKIVESYRNMISIMAPLLTVKALPFGDVLYSVSLVQSKENYQEKKIIMIWHGQMNNIGKSRGQD